MKIAILGTGMVGTTLARDLTAAGQTVTIGTRDPQAAHEVPTGVTLATFEQAPDGADLVINALNGAAAEAVLAGIREQLAGLTLLELSNPLDFSQGFPPRLFTEQTDSLAERIQRALPDTRVVKSLNTLTAPLMLNPSALAVPTSVFLSGDDTVAKQQVRDLLTSFGWEQIIDLGGIETARGAEMLMPMWLQLMQTFGGPMFNWSVVRAQE